MSTTLPTSSATRKKRKRTKLIECVNSGNVDKIVKILVNLDPNFIDEPTGETPLGLAASAANQQTITLQRVIVGLVNGGAMLDFRNKEGKTALHTAVIKSNYVALKTFLDLGASPNFKDSQGLTPLFCTIINKSNAKLTQLLLHEHSIHGLRDQHGWCEVHHACKLGLVGHLEQMLYYGADMNCHIVGSGNTPLHVAAINDQTECARLLLLRGCDASLVNNSHQNAYQVGVIAGNLALAEMIKGHRQENVVPYRDKPKYNPARRPGGLSADFTPRSILVAPKGSQPAGTGRPCCPASPCLSQRSCATSASLSTTSSSGGCCDMSSHSESACESDATGSHGFETGTSCTSEDESAATTITAPAPGARVEGRREQKLLGVGSSTTLPVRGRRTQQLSSQASSGLSSAAGTSSPTGSDSGSNQSSSGSDQTPPPITSYNEKTVSLHRVDKGFGFVLRGAKATSPVMGQQVKSLALQPISLQYLDEIETDGVAQLAGLCRGDFLLNVNGVDVRQAPHEHVVQLIRQSGDKVTMTVASPQYLKLDAVEAAQEKATKERARAERKAAKQRTSGGDLPTTNGADEAKPTVDGQSGEANKENDPERGRSKAPPPAPPRRDPSTTLTASRTRAKSLCLASGGSDTASVDSGTSQPNCKSGNTSDTTSSDHRHSSDNYDSEGRSTKSSSPTTSIESMVQNNNGNNQKKAPSKIASIRSRGTQRMSSCELEEFFARQDDKDASKRSKGNNTSATMRRKSKKKLTKSYHSTPDIQQELLLEQQRLANQGKSGQSNQEANKKSSSQEDVTSHVIYAAVETLTLKNGRIVTSSTCFRQTSCPAGQEPPSSLPAAENTGKAPLGGQVPPPLVVKIDSVNCKKGADYAHVVVSAESNNGLPQSLSSFRPPPSGQEKKGTEAPIVTTDDQGLPPPPQQPAPTLTNLRPGKGLKSSLVTSSVYSGQESIDLLDDELSDKMAAKKAVKPFIPEPDYSSEEESERHDGPKRDLSTFRAPVVAGTQLPEKQIAQAEVALEKPDIVASSMTARKASMDSNMSLTSSSSSTQSTAKEQLKAAEKSSDDSSSSSGSQSLPPPPSFPPPVPQATGDSLLSEGVNKVKATIRELERRSSLTGSDAVPASSTLRPQKKPLAECTSSSSASSSSSSAALRMSRSCFEVDCMDSNLCQKDEQPRSLGTINFDGMSSTQTIRTVQTSARRNSAQLSEKIASLVAAQASLKLQQSLADGADSVNDSSTYGTIGSKAAPTTAKTWSEISSEIRAVKGAPVTVVSNSISSQSVARPVSAPSARQMAAKSETIKVHVNAPGSAAANEVDVMAELVPPPPQFAAPPPHQQGHPSGNQVQRAASAQLGQRAGQIQLQVQGHPPRQLSPQTQPGTIKILTGPQAQQQHHVIHKPKASPAAQLIADHSAQQDGRKTATPPPPPPEFCDTSAAARLGVSCHSQQLGNHNLAITAAQWAAMTPQQQQQYRAYVQQIKHQQLTQQQFATLGRSYSGARQSQVQQQQQQAGQVALSRSTDALEPGKHYVIYPASSSSPAGPQYHQFATLSRAQQGQAAKAAAAAMSYNDFTRLTVQNRLVRQNQASPQPNQMSQQQVNQINQQQQHPQQFILTQQQAQQLYQKQQQQQAHATHAHEAGGTGQQPQQQTIYIGHHHHPQPPLTAQQLQQMAMQHQAQVAHQHMHHQPQHSGQPQGGQARPTTPQQQQQQQMMLQQQARYQMMQQQQQQQQMKQGVIYQQLPPKAGQAMPAAPAVPPPPGPTPSQQPSQMQQQPQRQVPAFLRKSMVEWVSDDIQEWLTTIGMGEHTGKLEGLTGVKLLRLDQNNLMELGIRQAQHRVYIQEKVKQLLHYQQQHPSAAN